MTRPAEDRLARALDRIQAGTPMSLDEDPEVMELLETAGYVRENLTLVPPPESFRKDLRDWLVKPRRAPWWRRLMEPAWRRIPRRAARRSALGAAIGLGAAAAIFVGVVALRRRRLASAV